MTAATARLRLTNEERQRLHALGGQWFDDFPDDLDEIVEDIVTQRVGAALRDHSLTITSS